MEEIVYPTEEDIGVSRSWDLPLDYGQLQFDGELLGLATTHQEAHTHPGEFAPRGRKCQGCRWSELHIFRESDDDRRFIIYTVGASDVPEEIDRCRVRYGSDAWEAVYALSSQHGEDPERRMISFVARRAIEKAGLREPDFVLAMAEWDQRAGATR